MKKMTSMSDNKGKNIIEIIALIIGLGVVVYLVLDMMKPKTQEPVPQPQNNTVENDQKEDTNTNTNNSNNDYSYLNTLDDSKYLKKQADGTYLAEITLDEYDIAMHELNVISGWWGLDQAGDNLSTEERKNHKLKDGQVKYIVSIQFDNKKFDLVITNVAGFHYEYELNDVLVTNLFISHIDIFNNKYIVFTGTPEGTGPRTIMKIYDSSLNKVFEINSINGYENVKIANNLITYSVCDSVNDNKKSDYEIKYNDNKLESSKIGEGTCF